MNIQEHSDFARLREEILREETRRCCISRRGCCETINSIIKSSFAGLGIFALALAIRPPDNFPGKIDWKSRLSLVMGGAGLIAYSTRGVATSCFRLIRNLRQILTTPATLPE